MASIFSKAIAMVEGVAHSAHNLLVRIFGGDAVANVEHTLASILKDDVLKIFSDAITAAETLKVEGAPATGDQKRQAAFSTIATDLKASGQSLGTSAINLGIELVVGLIKSKAAGISAPPPAAPAAPATS